MSESLTPAWWLEGLASTLVREGVNKHRAREIANGYWESYCATEDSAFAALQEADRIMGHDDAETEWRDKWAHLWERR